MVRIKLAQICVVELERPGRALELLAKVDMTQLTPKQVALAKRIENKAHVMQDQGAVELDSDDW